MKTMTLTLKKNIELKIILAVLQGNQLELESLVTNPSVNWKVLYKLILLHRVWHQVYAAFTPLTTSLKSPLVVANLRSNPEARASQACNDEGVNNDETTSEAQYSISIYSQLEYLCKKDKMRILTTAAETLRIAREFTKHNLQHCFLKGVSLNESLYGGLITRPCKDIDVWVDMASYRRAMETLFALGYKKTLPIYELKGFKEDYYIQHKHDIAFYHEDHKIEVELHFRLSYFGINFFSPSPKIFKSTHLLNTPIQTLEDNYHLLYLMIHGAIHGFIRLRWLNDIALYINKNEISLTYILELAKQIHCEHIVVQTLILIRDMLRLETLEIQTILSNPNKRSAKLATFCKSFITDGYELNCGAGVFNKHFYNYRFYLIKLAVKGQRMNAALGDLFKIDNVFPHVTFPVQLKFMYYALYPAWIIKYVIFRK